MKAVQHLLESDLQHNIDDDEILCTVTSSSAILIPCVVGAMLQEIIGLIDLDTKVFSLGFLYPSMLLLTQLLNKVTEC